MTLLKAGVRGHRRLFRKRLKAVATDRGSYSRANEDWLRAVESGRSVSRQEGRSAGSGGTIRSSRGSDGYNASELVVKPR